MTQSIVALDLIKRSMYLIKALAAGETPDNDQANDALLALNEMIDSWSLESLAVYGSDNSEFTLVPGKSKYTWGATGDFPSQRPVFIDDIYCVRGGVTTPVYSVSVEEWNAIPLKSLSAPLIEKAYVSNDFPDYVVNIWPVPTEAVTLGFSTQRVLDNIASLQTVISLPPGYLRALRYNLAMELWGEYETAGVNIDLIRDIAAKSKGLVKVANSMEVVSSLSDIPNIDTARSWDWRLG